MALKPNFFITFLSQFSTVWVVKIRVPAFTFSIIKTLQTKRSGIFFLCFKRFSCSLNIACKYFQHPPSADAATGIGGEIIVALAPNDSRQLIWLDDSIINVNGNSLRKRLLFCQCFTSRLSRVINHYYLIYIYIYIYTRRTTSQKTFHNIHAINYFIIIHNMMYAVRPSRRRAHQEKRVSRPPRCRVNA